MNLVFVVISLTILFFGFVVAFGAPYLPTLSGQIKTALDLLDLKPGQTMLELGCGDGRVARAAAKRGIKVVGYELNPLLVVVAKANTFRYRKLVKIRWGSFWMGDWPKADGIFVFLFERFMKRLDKKITQQYMGNPIKLVSFAFKMPGKKPYKMQNGVLLYMYE